MSGKLSVINFHNYFYYFNRTIKFINVKNYFIYFFTSFKYLKLKYKFVNHARKFYQQFVDRIDI